MVIRFIRADITTPNGAPRLNYPEGWYENAAKIIVHVYDDEHRKCLAELDDAELFQKLMDTGRVEEITETEMEAEVARLRPSPLDVRVTLRGPGKGIRTALEDLLDTQGATHQIEEE